MGLRYRRSIQVAPGLRLNFTKTGIGFSVGPRGLRYSVHSTGRRTLTMKPGIPGLWFQETVGGGSPQRYRPGAAMAAASGATESPDPHARPAKPGLFARRDDKRLYGAIAEADAATAQAVAGSSNRLRLAGTVAAGLMLSGANPETATSLLSSLWEEGADPSTDAFLMRHAQPVVTIPLEERLTVNVPLDRAGLGLVLATLYEQQKRLDEAIAVLEQVEENPFARIALARLYVKAGEPDGTLRLTDGLVNVDDPGALLLVMRARALDKKQLHTAALDVLGRVLRPSREVDLISMLALRDRARTFESLGQSETARRDIERIMSVDTSYPGAAEALDRLSA